MTMCSPYPSNDAIIKEIKKIPIIKFFDVSVRKILSYDIALIYTPYFLK